MQTGEGKDRGGRRKRFFPAPSPRLPPNPPVGSRPRAKASAGWKRPRAGGRRRRQPASPPDPHRAPARRAPQGAAVPAALFPTRRGLDKPGTSRGAALPLRLAQQRLGAKAPAAEGKGALFSIIIYFLKMFPLPLGATASPGRSCRSPPNWAAPRSPGGELGQPERNAPRAASPAPCSQLPGALPCGRAWAWGAAAAAPGASKSGTGTLEVAGLPPHLDRAGRLALLGELKSGQKEGKATLSLPPWLDARA